MSLDERPHPQQRPSLEARLAAALPFSEVSAMTLNDWTDAGPEWVGMPAGEHTKPVEVWADECVGR